MAEMRTLPAHFTPQGLDYRGNELGSAFTKLFRTLAKITHTHSHLTRACTCTHSCTCAHTHVARTHTCRHVHIELSSERSAALWNDPTEPLQVSPGALGLRCSHGAPALLPWTLS